MSGVAVVIVAHDSGPLLVQCVSHVLADAACRELCVVDNASGDGSVAAIAALDDSRIRLEAMGRNAGFAVACNRGAALTTAPWLLFLNPDALVEPDAVSRLRAIAAADVGIGLLGADVRDAQGGREGAARRRDPTLARLVAAQVSRWPGLGRWAASGLELPYLDEPLSTVDATSGALMLLPRTLFARIGGFDEGYFLHAEDLDLCRRVRDAGARVAVANEVSVVHVQGTSSRRRPFFVIRHKHLSLWRYLTRHDGLRAWTPRGIAAMLMLTTRALMQAARAVLRPR